MAHVARILSCYCLIHRTTSVFVPVEEQVTLEELLKRSVLTGSLLSEPYYRVLLSRPHISYCPGPIFYCLGPIILLLGPHYRNVWAHFPYPPPLSQLRWRPLVRHYEDGELFTAMLWALSNFVSFTARFCNIFELFNIPEWIPHS